MTLKRSWSTYPPTYRTKEIETLAGWVSTGFSGSVVGLAGAGKSNLLGFLCHHPQALQAHLPAHTNPPALIQIDLNNLPSKTLATFYRVFLRSFYEVRDRFEPALQQNIARLYLENRAARDPFLSQSALRELLLAFQAQRTQVVLVLDNFDRFCQTATPQILDTLRGLRDSFKDILCYIAGMGQEVVYASDPADLGEMYELLDMHVCWVGPMSPGDAQHLIAEEMGLTPTPPNKSDVSHLLSLSGGYPALLKAACHWWLHTSDKPAVTEWASALMAERSVQSRLEEIWIGLTQEERQALSKLHKWQTGIKRGDKQWEKARDRLEKQHDHTLGRLAAKGLCRQAEDGWQIFCPLFATYVAHARGRSSGKIWLNDTTNEFYRDQIPIEDLSPLEGAALRFFVENPRIRHTKTDLITNVWPDELCRNGITDESLYQVIRELRKKIEPNPVKPCHIITWRGQPEGGYQFFPEGRPG